MIGPISGMVSDASFVNVFAASMAPGVDAASILPYSFSIWRADAVRFLTPPSPGNALVVASSPSTLSANVSWAPAMLSDPTKNGGVPFPAANVLYAIYVALGGFAGGQSGVPAHAGVVSTTACGVQWWANTAGAGSAGAMPLRVHGMMR